MRILLLSLLLVSISLSAQKEDKRLSDTAKIFKLKELPEKTGEEQKNPFKMLSVIPKDTASYMSLKEAKKDHSKYRILNTIAPEKTEPDKKGVRPSQ